MDTIVEIEGHWIDEPTRVVTALVSLGSWDGNEDDQRIFYYMDGEPLTEGSVIALDFVVDRVAEVQS